MIGTCNPGGPGHSWVKERYIVPAAPGTPFQLVAYNEATGVRVDRRCVFIPARVWDNKKLLDSQPDYIDNLYLAAPLHDIGKVAVPEAILSKPGKLTPEEFEKVKVHPTIAADLLTSANFPANVTDCVRYMREHWDGGGYPHQLKEAEELAAADSMFRSSTPPVVISDSSPAPAEALPGIGPRARPAVAKAPPAMRLEP